MREYIHESRSDLYLLLEKLLELISKIVVSDMILEEQKILIKHFKKSYKSN